jgi:hypothetical protein
MKDFPGAVLKTSNFNSYTKSGLLRTLSPIRFDFGMFSRLLTLVEIRQSNLFPENSSISYAWALYVLTSISNLKELIIHNQL